MARNLCFASRKLSIRIIRKITHILLYRYIYNSFYPAETQDNFNDLTLRPLLTVTSTSPFHHSHLVFLLFCITTIIYFLAIL